MANEIYREIFVTREEYAPPIQYVQGANAIPIVVRICDYNIPTGAKANVFVKKPSGKSVQDTAVIDGNTVTIDVTTQMFAEVGTSIIQIQITNGQDVLITFDLPAMVRKNRTEPGAPESENEAAFFTELQEAANKARIAAQEANNAAQAAEDALSVLEGAVEGTIINDDTPSDVTTFSGRHIENTFLEKNGDGGNVIVTFQQAADRAGIESGDSLAVAFGKLAKFFTDIQSYVFSPPVNNLLSTDTSRPLSAAMGKQLQEAVESINSALDDRRTYCIDSGYTPRVELNMPAGTCALVCTEYGLHYVASLSTNYLNVPIFQSQDISEADRPIIIPYAERRIIAIRRAENTSENVRVVIITPFSTITKR